MAIHRWLSPPLVRAVDRGEADRWDDPDVRLAISEGKSLRWMPPRDKGPEIDESPLSGGGGGGLGNILQLNGMNLQLNGQDLTLGG